MFPVLEKHLITSLKTWCTKMLSGQEPADFPICVKKENLVYHMKVIHTIEKDKLQWNWCGKTCQSEHSYKNHYRSNCIKRYEEEEITPQMMFEAGMMVRAQARNLIQGLNTPIPTMFPDGDGGGDEGG